jgi:hypothetical protein
MTSTTFQSPYEQYKERNGQGCKVVETITEPDATHDEEVLPMYRVQFEDGATIEAWPEEIGR